MLAKLQSPPEKRKSNLAAANNSAVSAMIAETADLRDTLAKTEQQIRKMQKDLSQRENPATASEASVETAFNNLQTQRNKMAMRSARYQTKSMSPNLLQQDKNVVR